MEKNWIVMCNNGFKFYKTLNEAEDRAKKLSNTSQIEHLIYELISETRTPAPNIEIVPVVAPVTIVP